jgi:alkylation response protein AidB-like acyl-CoA dehydrogenase
MDVRLTDEQELLRRSIREFAETELRPHVREWDEAQQFPPALLTKFAELGLMGIQFPEGYGGAAMSSVDYCLCIEELARVDPSVCLSVAAHNGLGAAHIFMFGTRRRSSSISSRWRRARSSPHGASPKRHPAVMRRRCRRAPFATATAG